MRGEDKNNSLNVPLPWARAAVCDLETVWGYGNFKQGKVEKDGKKEKLETKKKKRLKRRRQEEEA